MIGQHKRLAYWNCLMDRSSFDSLLKPAEGPDTIRNREKGETMLLTNSEFDDLCRVHLFDWLEPAPRWSFVWTYRRQACRQMADRLDEAARQAFDKTYALEEQGNEVQSEN